MSFRRGPVGLIRFRVEASPSVGPRILDGVSRRRFAPLDQESGETDRSAGWVSVLDDGGVVRGASVFFRGDALLGWRIDQVRVPAALVRERLERWVREFELREGRRPAKPLRAEQKELIVRDLRKQAFVISRIHGLRWRVEARELQVWATSARVVDEMVVAAEEDLGLRLARMGPGPRWTAAGWPTDGLAPTAALFGEAVLDG